MQREKNIRGCEKTDQLMLRRIRTAGADLAQAGFSRMRPHAPACAMMIQLPSLLMKNTVPAKWLRLYFWQRNSVLIQCTTFDGRCIFRFV